MKQDHIWTYYQNEAPEVFAGSVYRLRHLAARIAPISKVLNIGVGTGLFEKLAAERGLDVYCVDPDGKAIDSVRHRLGLGDRARVGYAQDLPFEDGLFDAVVASEVLEHLAEPELDASLEEIRRVLKPGGRFIGTVPARENLSDQMVVCPKCGERFHRWGHKQGFDPERLQDVLSSHFCVEEIKEVYFIPWKLLNWKGVIVEILRQIPRLFGGRISGANFVFSAAKP